VVEELKSTIINPIMKEYLCSLRRIQDKQAIKFGVL